MPNVLHPWISPAVESLELPPFDPLNVRAAQLRASGHAVISLGQAVPSFPPPDVALATARAAVGRADVNRYATDPGLPTLREILATRLTDAAAILVTSDDLIITAGANHAFALAMATFVQAGDEVVLPSPYFTNHWMMVVAGGGVAIEAPISDRSTFAIRWEDIEPWLTSRTRAVVLCNPSNPTGAVIDAIEGRRIVGQLADRGVTVISDETYMSFVYEGSHWSAASVQDWRRNVVVIGTFSKMFGMMGWRVGFVLADAAACRQALKVQDAMIICAPVISQLAVEAAVREAWDYPRSFHAELLERRRALASGLAAVAGIRWSPTPAGMFAFARIDGCTNSARLSLELLELNHLVTIPGSAFGASGEGYLRLSYGFATYEEIGEATARLKDALHVRV